MRPSILRFLRRDNAPAPADNAIPGDVVEVIRSAEITFRDLGEEDGLVPIVRLHAGGVAGSWLHDAVETPARLKRRFPFLDDAQLKRCTDLVEALVMTAFRDLQREITRARRAKRKNWVTDW